MKLFISNFNLFAAAAALSLACFAAEPSKGAATETPVGPFVDVTLKSGEINKGQLLSFVDGNLTLKLENGVVVNHDGSAINSVRFMTKKEKPQVKETQVTADETRLTLGEINKLHEIRMNERKNNSISKEDQAEFKRLRDKTDQHIRALEREIKKVTNEDEARVRLGELTASYIDYGTQLPDLKGMLKAAFDSIESETVRQKLHLTLDAIIKKIDEERNKGLLKPKKPFDRIPEKPLMEKPPDKP